MKKKRGKLNMSEQKVFSENEGDDVFLLQAFWHSVLKLNLNENGSHIFILSSYSVYCQSPLAAM